MTDADQPTVAGLTDWVEVHQGRAVEAAIGWTRPIDLLFLDGDQSYAGVQLACCSWSPWYAEVHCIGTTTFARKLSDDE